MYVYDIKYRKRSSLYLDIIVASHAFLAGGQISGGFSCVCRFMHACTHASFLFWLFAPWYHARYKDMTDGERLIGFFSAGRGRAFKGPPSCKSHFSLSPETRLCSETVLGEKFEIAIQDAQERMRDLARGERLPVFTFRRFAHLNINHSTMHAK